MHRLLNTNSILIAYWSFCSLRIQTIIDSLLRTNIEHNQLENLQSWLGQRIKWVDKQVLLIARRSISNKLKILRMGIDDYVVKRIDGLVLK